MQVGSMGDIPFVVTYGKIRTFSDYGRSGAYCNGSERKRQL